MSPLFKSGGVALAIIAIAFGAGFFLPSQVHVERSILIDLDSMLGKDYEAGLQNLKQVVAASPRASNPG